ncbi:transposase family protein [Actinomyces sp. MRS3W]|uniref:transposase family protein n=1 Tax=Actinomyces sp. MRS3W TaxID=2800796 RepID=UPI0028FD535E|nr:transposase family protein [Actinomyces sp. MRS3W]MDU0347706.1 transposase family protein [Actinomyces sp. MRS3W]
MLSYRATLDVPDATARTVTRWLADHRRAHDIRPHQRAATCWSQTVMVLRWLVEATNVRVLARDSGISIATAYRYLHEALDVISQHAPDLIDTLKELVEAGESYVCLDGTLIHTDRVDERSESGKHLWYSGKHKAFGGNVQVLTDSTGYPVWVAPVEPGSTHDLTAARTHVLGAVHKAASQGMPTLADKGYQGAGIGVKTPFKGKELGIKQEAYNAFQGAMRAPAERANALLKDFKALKHVTLDPRAITKITATALVILNLNTGYAPVLP